MKKFIKLSAVALPLAFSLNANAADSFDASGIHWNVDSSITSLRSNNFTASTDEGDFLANSIHFTLSSPTEVFLDSVNAGSIFSFLKDGSFFGPPPGPGLAFAPFDGILPTGVYEVNLKTADNLKFIPNASIRFGSGTVTPAVPEPETYAMMLAGLALVGFSARRRQA